MGKKPAAKERASTDKRPHAAHNPLGGKLPSAPEAHDSSLDTPVWRIRRLETCDPFGCHKIDSNTALEVRARLASLETMKWQDILQSKQNHPVAFEDLSKEARDRLAELRLDQNEEFISLRVSAKKRIWGLREGRVLDLIFWDPDHKVCPSEKKNT